MLEGRRSSRARRRELLDGHLIMDGQTPDPSAAPALPLTPAQRLHEVFGSKRLFDAFTSTMSALITQNIVKKSSLAKRADKFAEFAESQMAMNKAFADGFRSMANQLALAERDRATLAKMVEDLAEVNVMLPSRIRVLEKRLADLESEKADHGGS